MVVSCVKTPASQQKARLCNDVGFPTVYRRIICHKYTTLITQTLRYICRCIRILNTMYMLLTLNLKENNDKQTKIHAQYRERSGSEVEYLTRDHQAAGSSLTGVTVLWSLSKTHLSLFN